MIDIISYHRPHVLEEALDLLAAEDCVPIAGGTDLIPQLRRGKPARLLDIALLGLDFIKVKADVIEIGTAVTHSRLAGDAVIRQRLPLLAQACELIGSSQIRNRGTIGGNIVNASPCADTVPVLLNFDAEVTLISKNGERRVKLGEFTNGPYSTIIRGDELLYSLECRLPVSGAGFAYIKLGRRRAVNISRMTLAAVVIRDGSGPIDQSRISAGSVFPTPARINEVENLLIGQKPCAKLFQEAGRLAADLMIARSGRRWSTPYKMPVLRGLLERALRQAAHLGMDRS